MYNLLARLPIGKLLAEVPGTLGFYPEDSLVLIFLELNDHTATVVQIARADLEDLASMRAAVPWVDGCDATIAVAVTDHLDNIPNLPGCGLHPTVTLHCPDVETGTAFTLIDSKLEAGEVVRQSLTAGKVGDVFNSSSLKDRLAAGEVIALNRAEAIERYAYTPSLVPDDILTDAFSDAVDLVNNIHGMNNMQDEMVSIIRTLRHQIDQTATAEGFKTNTCLLANLMACLAPQLKDLRDMLMVDAHRRGGLYRDALLLAARVTPDAAYRANALAMLMLVGDRLDDPVVLTAAIEADPHNQLVRLLSQAHTQGGFDDLAIDQMFSEVQELLPNCDL